MEQVRHNVNGSLDHPKWYQYGLHFIDDTLGENRCKKDWGHNSMGF